VKRIENGHFKQADLYVLLSILVFRSCATDRVMIDGVAPFATVLQTPLQVPIFENPTVPHEAGFR
jgi:hypothetical protein